MPPSSSSSGIRVAVVLSGCGFKDGSEIHEAVAALFHLAGAGAVYDCFAPDRDFAEVDHLTGKPTGKRRNMLQEAARIARGEISDLKKLDAARYDAILFPGGFGAATNLSDFAMKGADATALPEVVAAVKAFHAAGKPIGVICIAPAMLAAALKGSGIHAKLTVGAKSGASDGVEALGARHEVCPVEGIVVDEKNKIVSTPAYMCDGPITGPFTGIGKLVAAMLMLAAK